MQQPLAKNQFHAKDANGNSTTITVTPCMDFFVPYEFTSSEMKRLREGTGDLESLKFLNEMHRKMFYSNRNNYGRDKDGKQLDCPNYYERALKKRAGKQKEPAKSRAQILAEVEAAMKFIESKR